MYFKYALSHFTLHMLEAFFHILAPDLKLTIIIIF
jgi:hypothetical protein